MKDKKIELTEKDLHVINIYSKKNLTDTMAQFGNPDNVFHNYTTDVTRLKNEKQNNFFE